MKWSNEENYYDRKFYLQRRAMFNSMSRKCKCGKQACFNYPSIKYGVCCKSCKEDGMVNVRNKR